MADPATPNLLTLTAQIVAAHVAATSLHLTKFPP